MPDRQSNDYLVGYGRPPKTTRFQPGVSGNPRGRPKGAKSVGALLNSILAQRIAVTEGSRSRRMTTLEVMLRRLVNDAVRSEPRAMKLLLSLLERYGATQDTPVRIDDILAEDRAILAHYANAATQPVDGDLSIQPRQGDDAD